MSADRLRSELLTVLAGHGYTPGPSQRIVHVQHGVSIRVGSDGVHVERQGRKLFSTSGAALDVAGRILRAVGAEPEPAPRVVARRLARVQGFDSGSVETMLCSGGNPR